MPNFIALFLRKTVFGAFYIINITAKAMYITIGIATHITTEFRW